MAKKATATTNGNARRKPPSPARSPAKREISDPVRSFVDSLDLPDLERLTEIATARRNELRSTARIAFLEEVRSRAKILGVPLAELIGGRQERRRPDQPAMSGTTDGQRAKARVKYLNPETGETWTGLGRTAKWLAVLERAGHSREEYAVSAQSQGDREA